MSRLLELRPEALLKGGLRLSEAQQKEAALALGEQLRDEGLPADALGLWVSLLDLASQSPLTGESLERLHAGLKRVATTSRFAEWADTMVRLLVDDATLQAARELVAAAHRLRLINDTLLGK